MALDTLVVWPASGAPAVAVWLGWNGMHEPYKGYGGAEQFVTIRQGAASAEIGRALADARVVRDGRLFRAAVWWSGHGRSLKAGEYRFDRAVTPLDVIDVLVRGDVYTQRITFPEGLTIEEMAKLYETNGFGLAREFVEAARSPERIRDLDPAAADLEAYLSPKPYAMPRHVPASRVIGAMVDRFRSVYGEEMRTRAAAEGLTVRQLVTLASIVEKETGKPEERPMVAAVYRNRMKIGMPMQADPTIVYAIHQPPSITHPLPLGPLQLLAEELEVAARRRLDQAEQMRCFLHANDVAFVHGIPVLPVIGDEHVFGAVGRFGADFDLRISGNDDGPVGERVRRDWRQQQRID